MPARPLGRVCMRLLLTLLFFLHAPVWAQWNTDQAMGTRVTSTGRVTVVPDGDFDRLTQRTYSSNGVAGDVEMRELLKKPHKPIDFTDSAKAARIIPFSSAMKAVARGIPALSTALAVAELLDVVRCRNPELAVWECDDGQPEQSISGFRCEPRSGIFAVRTTRLAACTAALQGDPQNVPSQNYQVNCSGGGRLIVRDGVRFAVGEIAAQNVVTTARITSVVENQACVNAPAGATGQNNAGNITVTAVAPTLQCPPGSNGVQPVKGADGLCPTGEYTPASAPEVESKGNQYGPRNKAPDIVDAADNTPGGVMDTGAPGVVDVPPAVSGGRETTTGPDGSVTTRDRVFDLFPRNRNGTEAGGWDWRERTVIRDYAPGATIPPEVPQGNPYGPTPGGGTTTTSPPEVKGCGLPDTPPCKIDESGTPTDNLNIEAIAAPGTATVLGAISTIGDYAFPEMNWSFALPTACSVIPLPAFSAFMSGGGVDICQFQPMFHDIMSVIWGLGGLFGAIGLFWRDQLAGT